MRIDAGLLLAAGLILAGLGWGTSSLLAGPPLPAGPVGPGGEPARQAPDTDQLARLAARFVPAAEAEPEEPAAPAAPGWSLIGLIESDEGWVAVLSHAGETYTARPGERVAGYTLGAVDARSVVLERDGVEIRLTIER